MCTTCNDARPTPASFRFFAEGCRFCASRRIQYLQRTLRLSPDETRKRCRRALAQALERGLSEAEIRAGATEAEWALEPQQEGGRP